MFGRQFVKKLSHFLSREANIKFPKKERDRQTERKILKIIGKVSKIKN